MDIDRYIAQNEQGWDRLTALCNRARSSPAELAPAELEELISGYQRVSAQLSFARTKYADPALTARLTRLVATANGVIYGRRAKSWRTLTDFFVYTFPAAVYRSKRFVWASAALLFVPALLMWAWLATDPVALDTSAPGSIRREYVEEQFEQYYEPSPVFFAEVTTNNIQVTFMVFGAGIVLPLVGPIMVLLSNGAMLGEVGAWMTEAGDTGRFLGFILPHGMLELSAIVIAGGASLALGWSFIAPGDRRRSAALREEGRRLMVMIFGCALMLVVSGLIEGFITGSGLPTWVRVGIGALGWVALVAYLTVQGRVATALGMTGGLGERPRTWDDELTLDDLVLEADRAVATPSIEQA